jgi:predicted RNA-binding protein Jag
MQSTILAMVTAFWTGLGITTTSISVDVVWDDISIRVETPDSALLIGIHGKNIPLFQHILSRMIEKETQSFVHVHLEVNDYMKQKDEKLMRYIDSRILLIQSDWVSIRIPSLTAYERKKSHSYIADKQIIWLSTQSEGEWVERALVLSYTGDIHNKTGLPPAAIVQSEPTISDDGVGI